MYVSVYLVSLCVSLTGISYEDFFVYNLDLTIFPWPSPKMDSTISPDRVASTESRVSLNYKKTQG